MKSIYFIICIVALQTLSISAQNYKMLPDSSIYVHYGVSDGTSHWHYPDSWNYYIYKIDPKSHISLNNLDYIKVTSPQLNFQEPTVPSNDLDIVYLREDSNRLFMYDPLFSQEFPTMDFNLSIGDTAFGMYTSYIGSGFNGLYDAVLTDADSVLLSNGLYHKFIELNVFKLYSPNNPTYIYNDNYYIVWSEQSIPLYTNGLNSYGPSGIMHSYGPNISISGGLFQPASCFCDSLLSDFSQVHSHYGNLGCNQFGAYITNLSISENSRIKAVVYPNPTSDILRLQLDKNIQSNEDLQISIVDLLGKIIYKSTIQEFENGVDVSILNNGSYLLQVKDGKEIIGVERFIKTGN